MQYLEKCSNIQMEVTNFHIINHSKIDYDVSFILFKIAKVINIPKYATYNILLLLN